MTSYTSYNQPEIERRKPLLVPAAIAAVMEQVPGVRKSETIALSDSCGRILTEDVCADQDVPPFHRSAYDGYVLRAEDTERATQETPVMLEVKEEIAAGQVGEVQLQQNQTAKIMTGAMLPVGGDTVIMKELTTMIERDGRQYVSIKRVCNVGDNISFQGEEATTGDVLLPKGYPIHPGTIGLLASLGYHQVQVGTKPLVGVMSTGSELLEVHEPLQPGKIRNSNAAMISAQIMRAGGRSKSYGTVKDNLDECLAVTRKMLDEADLVITTGGVSVGDFDYIPAILEELGASVLFNKVAMRPGSVTTVAELNGKLFFGLSGNPSACYNGMELFVRPVIRKLLHADKVYPLKAEAKLSSDFPKANPFTRFVRAKTVLLDGELLATPVGLDKSSAVISIAQSNSLVILPGGTRGYAAGDRVDVYLLEDQSGDEWSWDNMIEKKRP